jgi:hypothetical protein
VEENEMIKFPVYEIPIANSMIVLAELADNSFQRYFCFWAAFNNIYTLVARILVEQNCVPNSHDLVAILIRNGERVQFSKKPEDWGYIFPRISLVSERKQIREVTRILDEEVKYSVISHKNTRFFVNRIPKGAPGKFDSQGQIINGVLNITRTVEKNYPVWSPIDKQAFERYINGDHTEQDRLAEQIIFMLYTIRNNLIHGSKSMNEANDLEVVDMALPILEIVVMSFIRYRDN